MSHASGTETIDAKLASLLKSQAELYACVVGELEGRDEAVVEPLVRRWLRAWASWRGLEMRKGHLAAGYPIDVDSVIRHWDSASTHHLGDEWAETATFSANRSITPIPDLAACGHAEVFREHGLYRWGHVFCDELHQTLVGSYLPGACVVIPVNLMKRDDRCEFQWVFPGGTEDVARAGAELTSALDEADRAKYARLWAAGSADEAARACMARTERNFASLWFHACREVSSALPDEADGLLRRAARNASAARGRRLRALHARLDLPLSPHSFLAHYDQMPAPFGGGEGTESKTGAGLTVPECHLCDVWQELGGAGDGAVLCRESYPAALAAYLPGASFELDSCRAEGDGVCRLSVRD